jgi:hypothetical protein
MSLDLHLSPTTVPAHGPVRRYPRTLFSVPVTLRHLVTGGIRITRGISLDISEGGLGAIVQGDLRVGEMVEIDVRIAEWRLSAVAIVRHTSGIQSGFEFLGLTAEERQQIDNATGNC